ncbi:MAG TPA: insulinase family protein [Roseiflexaceae bacterium]|nr:insulinase family protein [Roseiflexaceae bacterium]
MPHTHGFELLREQDIPEINTRAKLYRHTATGAELLSLENDDENKVFGITFRTPPADSTGVAHILEHCVLCGSRKYPLRDPFKQLLKGSLQTFLNAMTYPDKTTYPVASTNLQDFYNLVDVYLDAVLHPRITPDTLMQEGWHYELDADGRLVYKGVVFNEMKGANASPDRVLYQATQSTLFPDTPYAVDSGGNPADIPDLTYEQFKRFHETLYHPSNARIFFYGDDPPEERLRRLDAVLREFAPREVDSSIALQPRFAAPRRAERTYPAGADAKAMVSVSWVLPEQPDAELALALDILQHALVGTNAAPLRKALIDSGLGENLTGSYFNTMRQVYFTTGLKGVKLEDIEQVEPLVLETLERLARDGIDPQTIEASLNTVEFQLRENNTGSYPRGLSLMLRALDTWLYGGDPLEPLAFEAPLAALKRRLAAQPRYFEDLINRLLLENPHRATVLLRPDQEQAAREQAAERARLDRAQATMTPAGLEEIARTAARLKQLQDTPDPPEVVARLPTLTLADLDPKIKTVPTEEREEGGARVLYHELFTNGIIYLDLGLNLRTLPQEFLPYVTLFARALLETGTATADMVQLSQRIGRATGGITHQSLTSSLRGRRVGAAWLFLRGKAVPQKAGELLAILDEVLKTARLDNRERFRQIVLEEKAAREAGLVPGGHSVVNARLRAQFNEADWAGEQIGGLSYLLFLRRLAKAVDEEWPTVQAVLEQLRTILLNRDALVANVTTDASAWAGFRPQLASFLAGLPHGPVTPAAWEPRLGPANEGLTIPAQVNYVGKGADLYRLGYELHGSALVVSRYLRGSWLWDQIREQGGAYSMFSLLDPRSGAFTFVSYRDPHLLRTLDVYDRAPEFLRGLELSETELTRAIIGVISDLDSYQLPDARGFTALVRHLVGDDDEYRQRIRDEVLGTSGADFRRFADVLDRVREQGRVVVLGGEAAITAAAAARPGLLDKVTKVL